MSLLSENDKLDYFHTPQPPKRSIQLNMQQANTSLLSLGSDLSSPRPISRFPSGGSETIKVEGCRSPSPYSPFLRHFNFIDTLQIPDGRSNSSGSSPSLMSSTSSISIRPKLPPLFLDDSSVSSSGISRDKICAPSGEEFNKAELNCPLIFINQPMCVPKFPFCEEFDGINMRRTKTISESIVALIEAQLELNDEIPLDVVYRSSVYFDRIGEIRDIIKFSTEQTTCEGYSTPLEYLSQELDNDPSTIPTANPPSLVGDSLSLKDSTAETRSNITKKSLFPFPDFSSEGEDENVDVGSVDLKVKYLLDKETIQVTIIKAEDVFDPDKLEKQINPFIKVSIYQQNKRKKRTKVVRKCRNPVFQEVFKLDDVVHKWLHVTCLLVQLYHKKRFGSRCLGGCLVWLDDLDLVDNNEDFVTEILRTSLY